MTSNDKQGSQARIAVVGATGVVGETMLSILSERGHKGPVHALASERSLGSDVEFGRRQLPVKVLDSFDFSQVDYALFSAGSSVSREWAPRVVESGCTVIDNSSAFRYDEHVPLVVPEVNGHQLSDFRKPGIIANPNCSTIQLVVALAPIHRRAGIARIQVATYQSVSGAGRQAMETLARQTADRLGFRGGEEGIPQAFNVVPRIDTLQDNGYTFEEMKLHLESCKILEDPQLLVNATAVRVPVFFGHAEAVHLETREDLGVEEARALLAAAPGIQLTEAGQPDATPQSHAAGNDAVFVSRLRRDHTHPRGLNLWVVADNVRKGAALNAVQILEGLEAVR